MKKTVISMLLVLALVLCFVLVAAPAAQAVNTTHEDHCVCGGTSNSVNNHACATADDWQKWDTADALPTTTGKYWLATNVTLTSTHTMVADADVVICLNGNKITGSENPVIELVDNKLTICDCSKVETADGYTYSGEIKGTTDDANQEGGIIKVSHSTGSTNPVLTIYGGNFVSPVAKRGCCILSYSSKAVINIYEGSFVGNTAIEGGCFYVDKADINVYGGVISGGSATSGGAIYMKSSSGSSYPALVKIAGGVIKDCTATNGGAIYFGQKDCQLEIAGGKIENCTATGMGGAIYVQTLRNKLTVSGGEIVGCTANEGDAIYAAAPTNNYVNTYFFTGGKIVSGKNTGKVIAIYAYNSASNVVVSQGITKMGMEIAENGSVGVGYITGYTMSDAAKALLTASASLNNTAYGLKLWTENGTPVYAGYNDQNAVAVQAHLRNIMNGGNDDAANAVVPVKGAAYAVIGGTVVESAPQSFTLKNLVEKMDAKLTDTAALDVLKDLYKLYENVMSGWTLSKINAA